MSDFYYIVCLDINNLQIAIDNNFMTNELWVCFYNSFPNTTTSRWKSLYPNKDIKDLVFGYKLLPDFLSFSDIKSILSINDLEVLNRLQIPKVQMYYNQIVNSLNLTALELIPEEFLYDTTVYAINNLRTLEYPVKFTNKDKFHEIVNTFLLRILDRQHTFGVIERLYKTNRDIYDLIPTYKPVYKELVLRKINKYNLYSLARELHINPFIEEEKIKNSIDKLIDYIFEKSKDEVINLRRAELFSYWKTICLVEYNKIITEVTNNENCLLENVLDYSPFDTVPLIEDGKFYILTSPEFNSILEKNENPWTRKKMNDITLINIRCKLKQYEKLSKNDKIVKSLSEAIEYHFELYNEPPLKPQSSNNVYSELANLLSDYYITEESLRSINSLSAVNRLVEFIRETGFNVPQMYTITPENMIRYLIITMTISQDRIPSIAMAINSLLENNNSEEVNPIAENIAPSIINNSNPYPISDILLSISNAINELNSLQDNSNDIVEFEISEEDEDESNEIGVILNINNYNMRITSVDNDRRKLEPVSENDNDIFSYLQPLINSQITVHSDNINWDDTLWTVKEVDEQNRYVIIEW